MTVRVSVVTISYNDLVGLRRTLPSVRNQRGGFEVEHIVIDGGSGALVEQFLREQEATLAYWHSRPDGGRYHAMNDGLLRATGDVVWFMHSGDRFSDPDVIAAALLAAGRDVQDTWGFGRARLTNGDRPTGREWGIDRFDVRRFALGDRPVPHQAAFFGAGLLRKLGCYDEGFGLAADQLYMLRAARLRPPMVLDRLVCDFDTSGAGSVRSLHEHYRDSRRAFSSLGYYPVRGRGLSVVASCALEASARGKLAIRTAIGR